MLRFLVRRTLLGALVVWIISIIVFALFFIAPSNVARKIAGRQASAQQVQQIRETLGLNKPPVTQYREWVWGLLHGDLGFSYYSGVPVTEKLADALPVTLSLIAGASVIWVILGLSIGVLSATRPRTLADRAATTFALFFYSMPTFLLGLLLLYFLFFRLHQVGFGFFPACCYVPITESFTQWAKHMILPWFTLALVLVGYYIRLTRGSMLDALGEDYIRTARAKGIRESRVTYRHGLRSGLTPVVTQFGVDIGTAVGGVLITETVFGIQGLGFIAVRSVIRGDLPVISAVILLASVFVVVANIVVDAVYAVLDPRVRLT